MLVTNIRAGLVANIRDLKTERVTFEKEKQQLEREKIEFRAEMETTKKEFKAEVSKKNKAFLEREWSIHKNEDKLLKLVGQNSKEESRLRSLNLYSLIRERKQQEVQQVQEQGEARIAIDRMELSLEQEVQRKGKAMIASHRMELSLEREVHAERFQKENEILAVRENNQQQKEDKFRNDEDKKESLLISMREYLIEATAGAEMTASAPKRKNEKRESATRKSFSKEKMTGDYEWVLDRPRRKHLWKTVDTVGTVETVENAENVETAYIQ